MKTFPVLRTCALRPRQPRSSFLRASNAVVGPQRPAAVRHFADDKSRNLHPAAPGQSGPNVVPEDHVSEEAAKIAKAQGLEGPDLSQGTPVQEILKDDKEAHKHAPQAVKDSMKAGTTPKPSTDPSGQRSFSTYARRRAEMDMSSGEPERPLDPSMVPSSSASELSESSTELTSSSSSEETTKLGHKFPLPDLPLPKTLRRGTEDDPIYKQVIGLIMRDGKKATAERNLGIILNTLRTNSPPTYDPNRPLIPGAPPASHLPLNPILYLTLAIDSLAPLLRIRSLRGAAGGGASVQIPVPLTLKQRRRTAIMWILDSAGKRRSAGSGKGQFALRVAQEIVSVVEGRSGLWDRRNTVHRLATIARINVNFMTKRR